MIDGTYNISSHQRSQIRYASTPNTPRYGLRALLADSARRRDGHLGARGKWYVDATVRRLSMGNDRRTQNFCAGCALTPHGGIFTTRPVQVNGTDDSVGVLCNTVDLSSEKRVASASVVWT
jgi:hypothetical protein